MNVVQKEFCAVLDLHGGLESLPSNVPPRPTTWCPLAASSILWMMAQSKLYQRKWSSRNGPMGQFLLLAAFWNGVLHRTQNGIPPPSSFRPRRDRGTIHVLGVVGWYGFRIG